MKKKILIIYATYGSGHKAIANYIERYFENKDEELEIKSIDLLEYSNSYKGRLGKKISENLMLHHPFIWNLLYKSADHKYTCALSSNLIMKPFKNKRLEREISEFNPDLTIATHFYGSSIIAEYNKKGITHSKIISIVTDYEAHELWLKDFKKQNYLVVPCKEEQKLLVREGYNKNKIKPYGIPIFPNLKEFTEKEENLKRLGLNPNLLTCVCFTGGGNGSTGTIPYVKAILKQKKKINLIIISGKNKKAYDKVKNYIEKYSVKNVLVYGFVTNVPELLEVSDFVITKPGGAQTTECLYFRKPMLLIKSSGGQEEANIKYFTKNGYAKMFRTPRRLAKYFKNIDKDNKDLNKMHAKLSKTDNRGAIEKIYELTIKCLKEN